MPLGLTNAEPKLIADIRAAIYNSARAAMISTLSPVSNAPIDQAAADNMAKLADKFAAAFADSCAEPLSHAIYDFVVEIGIIARPIALVAGQSPVAGVINPAEFEII